MIIGIILAVIAIAIYVWGPLDHLILSGICAGALIVWRLIAWAVLALVGLFEPKKRGLTNKELEQIRQAAALDEENKQYNKQAEQQYQSEYKPRYQEALRNLKQSQKTSPEVEQYRIESENAKRQLAVSQMAVLSSTVVAPEDKNLETVNFLIKRLESRRADSVKEALNQMDEAQRRKAEEKARMEEAQRRKAEEKARADREASLFQLQLDMQRDMQRMERDRQAQWELDEMQRQWRRDQQARDHQKEMEWKAQQAQWELEEINRKLGRN